MDYIELKGIKTYAYHGVLEEEKIKGQNFVVDARLYLSMHNAAATDDLNMTLNYAEAAEFIDGFLKDNRFDLIETAAEKIALGLLKRYDILDKVDITLHKPQAPIPVEFTDVSVNITRGWKQVYLSIGSNMGDKRKYIDDALCKLKDNEYIKNVIASDLIITKPYGGVEQDDFLNGAIGLKTLLTPHELLDLLHVIENEANRVRTIHWGPRTLDLDIIFYENQIVSDPDLVIPHPDMHNRDFVLKPLMDLCPYYINPVNGKTVAMMTKELTIRE